MSLIPVPDDEQTVSPVRRPWLEKISLDSRALAERLTIADRDEAAAHIKAFAAGLPNPEGQFDRVMLRELLLDAAFKSGLAIHQRQHSDRNSRCPFSPTALLDKFWDETSDDPLVHFERWRVAFFEEFNKSHPPSLASSVGRLVKHEYRKPWKLRSLAHRFHTTPRQIRQSFSREFGSSVREYHSVARLLAALSALRSEKVDAVASSVGYRSKKNFYRAFLRLTGLTPGEFKKASPKTASDLQVNARARLVKLNMEPATREPAQTALDTDR